MTIKWATSPEDTSIIARIADRAELLHNDHHIPFRRVDFVMDITAAHMNGCPLKLRELLAAEPVDFSHDVLGIVEHLDRNTGQLRDCFLPRYAI